ncbi:uncharacterized protein LTR77_005969 [Saxophila tyrrhenica]|uniref:F-box domain-containing protein n=1 Tax=Saxophila tyrrhenica TaxID=1690608 RepID=A0AAV9P799_9PEZI|nr:hypothetical protein LTR77_005969 [Saxophila tyrrhenica]
MAARQPSPTKAPVPPVLFTYELLELILFELPTRDLLLSQRVCTRWKAVIENSTALQQALSFKAIPGVVPFCVELLEGEEEEEVDEHGSNYGDGDDAEPDDADPDDADDGEDAENADNADAGEDAEMTDNVDAGDEADNADDAENADGAADGNEGDDTDAAEKEKEKPWESMFLLNPLLKSLHFDCHTGQILPGETLLGSSDSPAVLPPFMLVPHASWRKMLPTQPPVVPSIIRTEISANPEKVVTLLQAEDASSAVRAYVTMFGDDFMAEDWEWWDEQNVPVDQCRLGKIYEALDEKLALVPKEIEEIRSEGIVNIGSAEAPVYNLVRAPGHSELSSIAGYPNQPFLENNHQLKDLEGDLRRRKRANGFVDPWADRSTRGAWAPSFTKSELDRPTDGDADHLL